MLEKLSPQNLPYAVEMALLLWPDEEEKYLEAHFNHILNTDKWICLLHKSESEYSGFGTFSIRADYVEGSNSSPVAYVEGIYVKENFRKNDIARQLVTAAEDWGKEKGCTEMGSDAYLTNTQSYNFHRALGFEDAGHIVHFIKKIE